VFKKKALKPVVIKVLLYLSVTFIFFYTLLNKSQKLVLPFPRLKNKGIISNFAHATVMISVVCVGAVSVVNNLFVPRKRENQYRKIPYIPQADFCQTYSSTAFFSVIHPSRKNRLDTRAIKVDLQKGKNNWEKSTITTGSQHWIADVVVRNNDCTTAIHQGARYCRRK
jgi:hypothetical protein